MCMVTSPSVLSPPASSNSFTSSLSFTVVSEMLHPPLSHCGQCQLTYTCCGVCAVVYSVCVRVSQIDCPSPGVYFVVLVKFSGCDCLPVSACSFVFVCV